MKPIFLTQGKIAIVDDADYEYLNQWTWSPCFAGDLIYALRSERMENGKYKNIMMHHDILSDCPLNMVRDHIDGNGLNNQRSNLRIVTKRQNSQNKHNKKTSKYPGVCRQGNLWTAQSKIGNEIIHLGYFVDEINAFRAYYDCILSIGETILDFPYPYEEEGEKEKIMENNIKYKERGFPPPMLKGKEYLSCMRLG